MINCCGTKGVAVFASAIRLQHFMNAGGDGGEVRLKAKSQSMRIGRVM